MNYFVSKFHYRDTDDIESIIKKRHGNNAFICDFYHLTPEIIAYLDKKYNFNEHGISQAIVRFRGNRKISNRQFFAKIHRKQDDLNGWLCHARFRLQTFNLDLGSWYGIFMPVIIVKINEKPMRFELNSQCPICLINMEEKDKEDNNIKYCRYGCGNCYHSNCYTMLNNKCGICRTVLDY